LKGEIEALDNDIHAYHWLSNAISPFILISGEEQKMVMRIAVQENTPG
jgi:hypothetical protein